MNPMNIDVERWHDLGNPRRLSAGGWSARAVAEADSPWFFGHFPDDPILPGIAQLSMALALLRSVCGAVRITGVRRVRFKLVIRPGDALDVIIKPSAGNDEGAYTFQIRIGDETACSGIMTIAPADTGGNNTGI